MPEGSIDLRLRSIAVRARYHFDFCGPACLLHEYAGFIAALPAGMGAGSGELTHRNLLFETAHDTLIKHRKQHDGAFFGVGFPFDAERQRQAFEILRHERPVWITVPGRECACSYEVEHRQGTLVCPAASPHAQHLAQKYPLRFLESVAECTAFLQSAWSLVENLQRLGLQHGDLSFYNFLETATGLVLIDLDDLMTLPSGQPSGWDSTVFLFHTLLPMAGPFLKPAQMSVALASARDGLEAVRSLRTLEMDRHASQLLEELHLGTAAELQAQTRVAAERLASLNAQDREIERLTAATAERLKALEACDRERELLFQTAQERLDLIIKLDQQLRSK